MTDGQEPAVDPERIGEALLALEGTVIEDLRLPLPGDLRDIAKAAALVSGVVEDRIPALLNSVRGHTWDQDDKLHAFEFRRFPIGFPDILLVERANPDHVLFQMEAKSWYILASDPLTARFETSPVVMTDGTIIAIVAWLLDGVVAGSPKLLRIHSDDALRLAGVRDAAWEAIEPPGSHRVLHPENAHGTPRNLVQTLARGEIQRHGRWEKDSDNYGKLDRLYDEQIRTFRDSVWSLTAAGKTLKEWHDFAKRPTRNAGLACCGAGLPFLSPSSRSHFRRTAGAVVTAATVERLGSEIRADYRARPVPRDLPVKTQPEDAPTASDHVTLRCGKRAKDGSAPDNRQHPAGHGNA